MKPLFPYFGGKRRAAPLVWELLGDVTRYVEPFFGSGAVLLGNPRRPLSELVNDRSHMVANFWRALQCNPAEVERLASAPCSEVELRARAEWLSTTGAERLAALDWGDLSACDVETGGIWLWHSCVAIAGHGLNRSNHGLGIKASSPASVSSVARRLSHVQVMCGDWSRCVTPSALHKLPTRDPLVGVFLDPPYGVGDGVAYDDKTGDTARDVWDWATANGDNPKLRIVVAGYEDGRSIPPGWQTVERVEHGGRANTGAGDNENRRLERLWASPHCLRVATQPDLFG